MDREGILYLIREFRAISKELRNHQSNSALYRPLNTQRNKIHQELAEFVFPGEATRTTKSWNNVINWMEKIENECINR